MAITTREKVVKDRQNRQKAWAFQACRPQMSFPVLKKFAISSLACYTSRTRRLGSHTSHPRSCQRIGGREPCKRFFHGRRRPKIKDYRKLCAPYCEHVSRSRTKHLILCSPKIPSRHFAVEWKRTEVSKPSILPGIIFFEMYESKRLFFVHTKITLWKLWPRCWVRPLTGRASFQTYAVWRYPWQYVLHAE